MEARDQGRHQGRRRQPPTQAAAHRQPAEGRQGRQPEVAGPIDPAPRLRVRHVPEDEVPEPTEAERRVSERVGPEVVHRPAEQEAGPGRLAQGGERLHILIRQGDVVDVAGLVPGLPEGPVPLDEPASRRGQDPLDRGPDDLVGPHAQGAVPLPEGIAERALDRHELAVDPVVPDDPGCDGQRRDRPDDRQRPDRAARPPTPPDDPGNPGPDEPEDRVGQHQQGRRQSAGDGVGRPPRPREPAAEHQDEQDQHAPPGRRPARASPRRRASGGPPRSGRRSSPSAGRPGASCRASSIVSQARTPPSAAWPSSRISSAVGVSTPPIA